jgi:DUF4097 and DUF4098 domain-containing protein YvlB
MSSTQSHSILAGFALASLAIISAGCNALDFVPLATATATVSETFETAEAPTIVVETFNGSIDISDGERNEVVVEVTKRAGGLDEATAEANLDAIEVSMIQKHNTIRVTARQVGRNHGNLGASVVIAAPKTARLQLKSSNGPIVCEGLQGGIEARTSNARVEVVEAQGAIDAVSSNGSIEIEASDAVVDARTSNARIKFAGSLAAKDQSFKTSNGAIDLVLPPDSQFHLNCSTSNASVSCKFPVDREGKNRRTRLKGDVGEHPSFSITATTSNAHIDIRQANAEAD